MSYYYSTSGGYYNHRKLYSVCDGWRKDLKYRVQRIYLTYFRDRLKWKKKE
jgi:hypothetical protein